MFFYCFDLLDDYIKNNFIDSVKQEQKTIDSILKIYREKKENLLEIINESTNFMDNKKLEDFSTIMTRI